MTPFQNPLNSDANLPSNSRSGPQAGSRRASPSLWKSGPNLVSTIPPPRPSADYSTIPQRKLNPRKRRRPRARRRPRVRRRPRARRSLRSRRVSPNLSQCPWKSVANPNSSPWRRVARLSSSPWKSVPKLVSPIPLPGPIPNLSTHPRVNVPQRKINPRRRPRARRPRARRPRARRAKARRSPESRRASLSPRPGLSWTNCSNEYSIPDSVPGSPRLKRGPVPLSPFPPNSS